MSSNKASAHYCEHHCPLAGESESFNEKRFRIRRETGEDSRFGLDAER
jgi:hypothetical protein